MFYNYDDYRIHGEARVAAAMEQLDESMKEAGYSKDEVAEATMSFKEAFNSLEMDLLDEEAVPMGTNGKPMSDNYREQFFQDEVKRLTESYLVLGPIEDM